MGYFESIRLSDPQSSFEGCRFFHCETALKVDLSDLVTEFEVASGHLALDVPTASLSLGSCLCYRGQVLVRYGIKH